ncbi:MAG: hypothetical protein KDB90_18070, partial [Planctomycetes bacterium]|nr:hypothetical protein [Planctomycetota bacterium]
YDPDLLAWLDDFGLCRTLHKGRSGASLDEESAFFLDVVRIASQEQICIDNYCARKARQKVNHG